MITDPAWFYSSLAQSAPAIVGLLAAVFGLRLIEHGLSILKAKGVVDSRLAHVRSRISSRTERLGAFGPAMQAEIALDEKALREGQTERTSEMSVDWEYGVRRATMKPQAIASSLAARKRYLELWNTIHPLYKPLEGVVSEDALAQLCRNAPTGGRRAWPRRRAATWNDAEE